MTRFGRRGIPWIERENYNFFRRRMADSLQFPPRWEDWREKMEADEKDVRQRGYIPIRVVMEPLVFAAWCIERAIPMDSYARLMYAREHVHLHLQKQSA